MKENLDRTRGLVHSQRVLLALTQAGVGREESYRLVQRNAMRAWNGEGALLDLLKADKDVTARDSHSRTREIIRPRLSPETRRYDLQAGYSVTIRALLLYVVTS